MSAPTKVILATRADWSIFERRFEAEARRLGLWAWIQGLDGTTRIEKPQLPPADLSGAAGQFQMSRYNAEAALYKTQEENTTKLHTWISSAVAPTVYMSCCDPSKDLPDWHTQLKALMKPDDDERLETAQRAYRAAITKMTKAPKDWTEWLEAWHAAMIEGQDAGLSETKNYTTWWLDFRQALQDVRELPDFRSWAQNETNFNRGKTTKPTFREISAAFERDILKPGIRQDGPGFVPGQAYGPTYDGIGPYGQGQGRGRGRGGRGRGGGSRKHARDDDICIACDGVTHRLEDCYTAFPEKAYNGFRQTGRAQRAWEKNQHKPDVRDAIQKVRQTMTETTTAPKSEPRTTPRLTPRFETPHPSARHTPSSGSGRDKSEH
jgi:hypothetical protein